MSSKGVKRISGVPHTRLQQVRQKPPIIVKKKVKKAPVEKPAPSLNISTDVIARNVHALDIYTVPIKDSLAKVRKIPGSIVLNIADEGFYGFNGLIWTPFKTPPTGIKTVLSVDNNAHGQSIVGLGNLQSSSMILSELNATTMNVSRFSLDGDLDLGGNNILAVNHLTTNVITATLYIGNINSFERITTAGINISTNIINTLIDFSRLSFDWTNRIAGRGNEIATSVAINENNTVVLVGTYNATLNIYNKGGYETSKLTDTISLYAGGIFTTAGGISTNRIIFYNGYGIWSTLASGLNNTCRTLALNSSGNLYAGGDFTASGGTGLNRIGMWNGVSWTPLGSGLNGICYAIAPYGTNLYAAGAFSTAGGVTRRGIAIWNGSGWGTVGTSGVNSGATCYAVVTASPSGTPMYIGGNFSQVSGVSANYVAKWSGTNWSALPGLNGICYALAIHPSGDLYAGGSFTSPGVRISFWNGMGWSAVGGGLGFGLNNTCRALAIDTSGNVYAGGDFTTANGLLASRVAKWNGSYWSALGSGLNGTCNDLKIDIIGNLYAAGSFTLAGGISANRIAKWDGTVWTPIDSGVNNICYSIALNSTITSGAALDGPLNTFLVKYTGKDAYANITPIYTGNPVWYVRIAGNSAGKSVSVNDLYYDSTYFPGYYRTDVTVGITFTLAKIYNTDNILKATFTSTSTISTGIVRYVELYSDPNTLASYNYYWSAKLVGNNSVQLNSTATDNSGNAIVTGSYRASLLQIYMGDTTLTASLENSGGEDTFIIKYNSAGIYQWATRLASPQTDVGTFIATNKSGSNIILTGYYTTSPLFIYDVGGTTLVTSIQSIGDENVFLVKYNALGAYDWVRVLSGNGTLYRSVCVDITDAGEIVVAGNYSGTLNVYNSGQIPVITLFCSSTFGDTFIVKYDLIGDPQWATRISSNKQEVASISVNNIGEIVVTGYFSNSTLNIFSTPGTVIEASLVNTGQEDVYLVKYNMAGVYKTSARIVSVNAKSESGKSISINNSGELVVTGTYTNTPSYLQIFDSTDTLASTLPFDNNTDSFLVSYNTAVTIGLPEPTLDGQNKLITVANTTVYVQPQGTVNGASQNIKLVGGQIANLIWDAQERNWIIKDNSGTLV